MKAWVVILALFLLAVAACVYFLIMAIQEEGGLL